MRAFIRRGSQSTKALFRFIDHGVAVRATGEPSPNVAIYFLVRFATYVAFLACLIVVVTWEARIGESSLIGSTVRTEMKGFESVRSLSDMQDYISRVVLNLVSWEPVAPANATTGKTFFNGTFRQDANIALGSIRIVQHRTRPGILCADPALPSGMALCLADYLANEIRVSEDAGMFVGDTVGFRFPWVETNAFCPPGVSCRSGTNSRVRPDDIFYPYSGFAMDYYGGSVFINGTNATDTLFPGRGEPLVNASVFGTVSPLTRRAAMIALNDFLDLHTRFVRISFVLFNAAHRIYVTCDVHFEITVTGAVQSWIVVERLTDTPFNASLPFAFSVLYCWVFSIGILFAFVGTVVYLLVTRPPCTVCHMASHPQEITIQNCEGCGNQVPLLRDDSLCVWCHKALPAATHCCWRTGLKLWRFAFAFNAIIYLISRTLLTVARTFAETTAANTPLARASDGVRYPPSMPFAPVTQLAGAADNVMTLCVVVSFCCMYRFVTIFEGARQILTVFTEGGLLLGAFFVVFTIIFIGFGLSFHVLGCIDSPYLSKLDSSLLAAVYMFINMLDWSMVSTDSRRWTFTVVYCVFMLMCGWVMFNLFISLLTYEYKRVAMMAKCRNVEAESLKLLLQPVISRVVQKVGVTLSPKKKKRLLAGTGQSSSKKEEVTEPKNSSVTSASVANDDDDDGAGKADVLRRAKDDDDMTNKLTSVATNLGSAKGAANDMHAAMQRLCGIQDELGRLISVLNPPPPPPQTTHRTERSGSRRDSDARRGKRRSSSAARHAKQPSAAPRPPAASL